MATKKAGRRRTRRLEVASGLHENDPFFALGAEKWKKSLARAYIDEGSRGPSVHGVIVGELRRMGVGQLKWDRCMALVCAINTTLYPALYRKPLPRKLLEVLDRWWRAETARHRADAEVIQRTIDELLKRHPELPFSRTDGRTRKRGPTVLSIAAEIHGLSESTIANNAARLRRVAARKRPLFSAEERARILKDFERHYAGRLDVVTPSGRRKE